MHIGVVVPRPYKNARMITHVEILQTLRSCRIAKHVSQRQIFLKRVCLHNTPTAGCKEHLFVDHNVSLDDSKALRSRANFLPADARIHQHSTRAQALWSYSSLQARQSTKHQCWWACAVCAYVLETHVDMASKHFTFTCTTNPKTHRHTNIYRSKNK